MHLLLTCCGVKLITLGLLDGVPSVFWTHTLSGGGSVRFLFACGIGCGCGKANGGSCAIASLTCVDGVTGGNGWYGDAAVTMLATNRCIDSGVAMPGILGIGIGTASGSGCVAGSVNEADAEYDGDALGMLTSPV